MTDTKTGRKKNVHIIHNIRSLTAALNQLISRLPSPFRLPNLRILPTRGILISSYALGNLGEIGGVVAEEHSEHLDVLECHGRALSGIWGSGVGSVADEHDPRGAGLGSEGGAVEGRPVW